MKDIKFTNFKLNEREELTCKITIKDWDYTIWERELLKNAVKNWDMLDIEIVWLVSWDVEEHKKKKLIALNMNMLTYCEKTNESLNWHRTTIYKKYNVTSRKDMNIEDIEREVESYKMWIFEFSN
jgi:hypothetical protein